MPQAVWTRVGRLADLRDITAMADEEEAEEEQRFLGGGRELPFAYKLDLRTSGILQKIVVASLIDSTCRKTCSSR